MNTIIRICFILLVLSPNDVFSRAGGGGGGGSSSGSSSSHSSSSHSSSSHRSSGNGKKAPAWVVKIVIGIVICVVIFFVVIITKAIIYSRKETDLPEKKNARIKTGPVIPAAFKNANPGFEENAFKEKVKIAFLGIQDAWQNQELSGVRKWISDSIYQRFSLQFDMMKQLNQKNLLSDISVLKVECVKSEVQGNYSILTASVSFKMNDRFISKKIPELNENYIAEHAKEYWTFIKKSGSVNKDLYHGNSCPNCGNELNLNGGEVSKCSSCSTITYLGDYDWVLCDITQEDDYEEDSENELDQELLSPIIRKEDCCVQTLEDKAVNAFIHYLFASAKNSPGYFKRFGTDDVNSRLEKENDEPYVFNRFYINRATLSDLVVDNKQYDAHFSIVYTAQRVKLVNDKVKKLDKEIETRWGELTLSKRISNTNSKSKHWSYDCPHCGAPFQDSTSVSCSYCHVKINSPEYDWIVTAINKG